ncbi:hypothetical protein LCGC14_1021830 [marine sediment metagenome]|uniref:Uncharacterized protein n=1 Tax=marine sediment metagenome TaxID=412755 RepID=A0A0F9NIS1_9ZZZZ
MKYFAILLMMVCSAFAADEIHAPYLTGQTLYFVRYAANGDVFLSDGSASETWGTGGRGADDYDVAMLERKTGSGASGHYVGSFDTIPNIGAGFYHFDIFLQAGGSPADSDVPALFWGEIPWTGTAEDPAATQGDITDAHATTDGKIDTTDALVTSSHSATDGKIDTTDALITSSHSTTDGKIDTTDALITSSHSATDGLITTVDTVVDSILVLVTLMRDMMEGDVWIDTAPTPWQAVTTVKEAGGGVGGADLIRKDLKTISDVNVTSSNQRIDRTVEP